MSSVVYVNGRWCAYEDALVHVEDRGFQFADGVYEALGVQKGKVLDVEEHLARLKYSLGEIKLENYPALNVLPFLMAEAVKRNRVRYGSVYLQLTRGKAKRDHAFPERTQSSLVIIARALSQAAQAQRQNGVHVITLKDQRWGRCDIKSLNLLANVLGRQEALEQSAQEAWLLDEKGQITEGTASNAWIIKGNQLFTHEANHQILDGITRQTLIKKAAEIQLEIKEQAFGRDDVFAANEAFISSSIGGITPVLTLDGVPVPQGEKTQQLQTLMKQQQSS